MASDSPGHLTSKAKLMKAYIAGLGTALPPYQYQQKEVAAFLQDYLQLDATHARRLRKAFDHSGIQHRYSVLPDFKEGCATAELFNGYMPATRERMATFESKAAGLGAQAAERCLADAQSTPEAITHLITVSCTGLYAPGPDIELVEKLGIPTSVERTGIHFMGCYAVFNALKTAGYITEARPEARVLIVAVELCSLHFRKAAGLEQQLGHALFGDGAGAALITSQSPEKAGIWLKSFKSDLIPGSEDLMTWSVGDQGFDMFLSREIPAKIQEALKPKINELLAENNACYEDIGHLAAHPGGIRILDTIEEALPLKEPVNRASRQILQQYGNMSSPTILFVMQLLLQQAAAGKYPKGMLGMAFGPGLTIETGLFEITS